MSPPGQKLQLKLLADMDTGGGLSKKAFAQMGNLPHRATLHFTPARASVCGQSRLRSTSGMADWCCRVLPWRSVWWWPSLCSPQSCAHRPLLFYCRNISLVFRTLGVEFGKSHKERMGLHSTSEDWGPGQCAAGALYPQIRGGRERELVMKPLQSFPALHSFCRFPSELCVPPAPAPHIHLPVSQQTENSPIPQRKYLVLQVSKQAPWFKNLIEKNEK